MMGRVGRERKGNTNMNQELGCGELSPGQEGLAHLRPTGGRLSHESIRYLCVLGVRLERACQKAHPDFCKPPVLTVKVTVRKKKKKTENGNICYGLSRCPGVRVLGPAVPPQACSLDLPQATGCRPGPFGPAAINLQ